MHENLRFLTSGPINGGRPEYVNFGIGWHRLCLAMVQTKQNKTPKLITLLDPDQNIHLAGGEEFITAYIPIKSVGVEESDLKEISTAEARPNKEIDLSKLVATYKESMGKDLQNFKSLGNSKVNYASGILKVLSALKANDSASLSLHIAAMHKALTEIGSERGWAVGKG